MTRIEDLLRAATREAAADVTRESIRPLDVATLPLPDRRPRRRLSGPLAPLLAAAAVALVVALSLVLGSVLAVPRPPAGPPGIAGAPPYYVALTATGTPIGAHPAVLTVRSTATGKVLATVTAPRPYGTFNLVQGTADDRTFLVGAQVWHPQITGSPSGVLAMNYFPAVRLYFLRFDPADGHATLTPLPVPQFSGSNLNLASVSPDRTLLAIQLTGYGSKPSSVVRLYTLPGWAEHSVALPELGIIGFNHDNPAGISWTADHRTMSFVWLRTHSAAEYGVHLADTDALMSSGSLLPASRLALPMLTTSDTGNFSCDSEPVLSGNGKYILCGGHVVPAGLKAAAEYGFTDITGGAFPKGPVTQGFAEFSATTGKLITILGAWRAPLPHIGPSVIAGAKLPCVLWASPDASTVIGTANGQGIVIHGGRAQQIPWSSRITPPPASSFVPGAAW